MLRWPLWTVIGLILIVMIGIGAGPWLFYGIGLAKVDGRPLHASQTVVTPEDAEALWRRLRIPQPVRLDPVSPYSYVQALVFGDQKILGPSARIAWIIASSYNIGHLTDHRAWAWHLSGAALTVWLTRNWTPNELVAKAVELANNGGERRRF
jgi:hypothetical protein